MPRAAAGIPISSQTSLHPRLADIVQRHRSQPSRAPVPSHTREAFERLRADPRLDGRGIMLDSGCGTGASTCLLAQRHPDALVIGVDRSAARLSRTPELPANAILMRAELAGWWRLARAAGWRVQRHWLLQPNPWPKPAQGRRRWHLHPAFPDLLALGGVLELRCNWAIYAEEFATALRIAGRDCTLHPLTDDEPLSPFERKYRAAGQTIWCVRVDLDRD
jgi:tRNA G46 methylase TrmB